MHGTHHMPFQLPMKPTGCMQTLEHLKLENVFISSELVKSIISHRAQLRTVALCNAQLAAAE
jgi:hypothetical protein